MTTSPSMQMKLSKPLAAQLKVLPVQGPLSPLPPSGEVPYALHTTEAQHMGLVDTGGHLFPDIKEIAAVLNDPALEIRVAFQGLNETLALHAYANARANLVGFTPESDTSFNLIRSLQPEQLTSLLVGGLGMDVPATDPGIRAELTMEAVWTLAGLVDAMREEQLQNLLSHTTKDNLSCRINRIVPNIQKGISAGDSRWLCTRLYSLCPHELVMSDSAVQRGLSELEQLNWIRSDSQGNCGFSETWQPALMVLGFCVGSGVLAIRRKAAEGSVVFQVGLLRALGTLWSLDMNPAVGEKVLVQTAAGPSLANAVDLLIQNALAAICAPAHEQAPPPPPLPAPPPVPQPKARFCANCGQPVPPAGRFCPGCGAAC